MVPDRMAALKAKLKAQSEAIAKEIGNDVQVKDSSAANSVLPVGSTDTGNSVSVVSAGNTVSTSAIPTVSIPVTLGTAKTSEIDHLDFLSKMNRLAEAIHTAHPTMPVLLMQIHKQLRADPELVTTLDEDAIGIVVRGLQIQTKTELVSVALKESKTKAKKVTLSVDMF